MKIKNRILLFFIISLVGMIFSVCCWANPVAPERSSLTVVSHGSDSGICIGETVTVEIHIEIGGQYSLWVVKGNSEQEFLTQYFNPGNYYVNASVGYPVGIHELKLYNVVEEEIIWNANCEFYAVQCIDDDDIDPIKAPIPDIKVNGSDGPLTIPQGNQVTVTIDLDPGDFLNQKFDWWLVLSTPFGIYSYQYPPAWSPGIYVSFQYPLFDLEDYQIFSSPLPATGNYKIYFGVDHNVNAVVDTPVYNYVEFYYGQSDTINSYPEVSNLDVPAIVALDEEFRIKYGYNDTDGLNDVEEHHILMSDGSHIVYPAGASGIFSVGGFYFEQAGLHWVKVYVVDKAGNGSNIINKQIQVYNDDSQDDLPQVYKPNLYLYPLQYTKVEVKLNFLDGGHITKSIPDYGNGWSVNVAPSGLIDSQYDYLFYESAGHPNNWQKIKGYVIQRKNLVQRLQQLLFDYGLIENEVNDFIEYWEPLLKQKGQYFAFYPQTQEFMNGKIVLDIKPLPENILRLFFYVEISDSPIHISPPEELPKKMVRNNFTAVEWGVIMKDKDQSTTLNLP